jgi:hypothetical protein
MVLCFVLFMRWYIGYVCCHSNNLTVEPVHFHVIVFLVIFRALCQEGIWEMNKYLDNKSKSNFFLSLN